MFMRSKVVWMYSTSPWMLELKKLISECQKKPHCIHLFLRSQRAEKSTKSTKYRKGYQVNATDLDGAATVNAWVESWSDRWGHDGLQGTLKKGQQLHDTVKKKKSKGNDLTGRGLLSRQVLGAVRLSCNDSDNKALGCVLSAFIFRRLPSLSLLPFNN